jgi:putative ATP-binding cassette transporter
MNKKTLIYVLVILAVTALEVWGAAYLVEWREGFWEVIKSMHIAGFWKSLGIFSVVAGGLVLANGYWNYLINMLSIHSRKLKVLELLEGKDASKYEEIPNYKQRIEVDTWEYYSLGYNLLFGLLKSMFTLVVLSVIMWTLVPSKIALLVCVIYVVVATVLSRLIARPLVKTNYELQTLATDFRDSMCLNKFDELNVKNYVWAFQTKIINLFQASFGQASVIIPYLLLAQQYFSGAITFGVLMASASIIAHVIQDAGWIIASQDQINRFHSSRIRLEELEVK